MRVNKQTFNILAFSLFLATFCILTVYHQQQSEFQSNGNNGANSVVELTMASAYRRARPQDDDDFSSLLSQATSGREFTGVPYRTFPPHEAKFDKPFRVQRLNLPEAEKWGKKCQFWAVVTTIFSPPQESVRRLLYRPNWCIVVVGDKGKPKNYHFDSSLGENVIFLSEDAQLGLGIQLKMPWNSFGRKNIGYIFAIAHGAKMIWDFDDDNILKFWIKGAAPEHSQLDIEDFLNEKDFQVVEPQIVNPKLQAYNPYPYLGAPSTPCWPRGFPIDLVQNIETWETKVEPISTEQPNLGVLQSLADIQPDVDAMYRLTHKTPFVFQKKPQGPVLRIPSKVATPYNAQATLHFYKAFWALYLPISVPGRVSDIWRAYFAQILFPRLGIHVGFMPRPIVVQDRNPHSYTADFEAELPLYLKSSALVKLISEKINQPGKKQHLAVAMEQLWIDLYERGYIEQDDVYNLQDWLVTLLQVGYTFPGEQQEELPMQWDDANGSIPFSTKHFSKMSDLQQNYDFECNLPPNEITFGNSDLHEGCRSGLASIVSHMRQKMTLLGVKGKLVNYPEINKMPGVLTYTKKSRVLSSYVSHTSNLTSNMIVENYRYYRDDVIMGKIDAYICTFPAAMCQLWMAFEDKAIVFIPAHRYNLGRCTVKEWTLLDKQLKILSKYQQNTIGAMSRYDMEYLRYYTGLKPLLVPSYAGYYLDKAEYQQPVKSEYLIFTVRDTVPAFINGVKQALLPEFKAEFVHDIYKFYSQEDLTSHPAIISLPYSVMSNRLTEWYSLAIPLFMPSPKFFLHYFDGAYTGLGHDRTSTSKPYCANDPDLEAKMRPKFEDGLSYHPYSPNVDMAEDPEAEMYWMQYADFYDWPHIVLFDSYAHLKELVQVTDLQSVHLKMKEEMKVRKFLVDKAWCDIAARASNFS